MRTPFERFCLTAWTCGVFFWAWWLMAGMPNVEAMSTIVRLAVSYKLFGRL